MAINRICTSQEQSQKLIKLGIDVNTADMYWLNRHIDLTETKYELFVVDKSNEHIDFFNSYAVAVEKSEIIPAWSLTTLFDILPKQFDEYVKTLYWSDGAYHCSYENENWESKYWTSADNLIDACFKMILKLREYEKLYEYRSKQEVGRNTAD